jgi:hypothetical protein
MGLVRLKNRLRRRVYSTDASEHLNRVSIEGLVNVFYVEKDVGDFILHEITLVNYDSGTHRTYYRTSDYTRQYMSPPSDEISLAISSLRSKTVFRDSYSIITANIETVIRGGSLAVRSQLGSLPVIKNDYWPVSIVRDKRSKSL